jgi:hypothetical protein
MIKSSFEKKRENFKNRDCAKIELEDCLTYKTTYLSFK